MPGVPARLHRWDRSRADFPKGEEARILCEGGRAKRVLNAGLLVKLAIRALAIGTLVAVVCASMGG